MKTAVIVLALLLLLLLAVPACTLWAGKPPKAGMVEGKLRPCPGSPNCVCSDYPDSEGFIRPFEWSASPETAWEALHRSVVEAGGTVKAVRDNYLWVTFTTRFLRFVDDVEFRRAPGEGVIHVRSASRVGHSDFGVNRRRVERLRAAYRAAMTQGSAGAPRRAPES